MHPQYFELLQKGLAAELAMLPLDHKVQFLAKHKELILIEGKIAAIFANAFSADPEFSRSETAKAAFLYCINRTNHAFPARREILGLLHKLSPNETIGEYLAILDKLSLSPEMDREFNEKLDSRRSEELYPGLLDILKKNPAHIGAACALLQLDFSLARDPEAWLPDFRCPNRLKPLWQQELFLHYARRGLWREALPLWETISPETHTPYALTYAADALHRAGETEEALCCYRNALRLDPGLGPVRMRIGELEHPQIPNRELLHTRKITICLYSWNKSDYLEETLLSLSESDTGHHPIVVLLNGCSDDSRVRIEALRDRFPGREFSVIDLPTNIGAPAARNWLISLPQAQAGDYIAFMDDDITMPKDWLIRLLTEMETDPLNAVVGCKVVFPRQGRDAHVLQYLYRTVSFPVAGAFKLSMSTPANLVRDTGLYTFIRPSMNVMGCLHLLRTEALEKVGGFDLRFSPSQIDDIDHDLCACLKGYKIVYCGTVRCEHHQCSGVGVNRDRTTLSNASFGSIIGNDIKLNYKHAEKIHELERLSGEILFGNA